MSVSEEAAEAFGARICEIARSVGGLEALAARSGVPCHSLHDYARGDAEPARARLVALARASGVNVAWLAAGEGPWAPVVPITLLKDEDFSWRALRLAELLAQELVDVPISQVISLLDVARVLLLQAAHVPAAAAICAATGVPSLEEGRTGVVPPHSPSPSTSSR